MARKVYMDIPAPVITNSLLYIRGLLPIKMNPGNIPGLAVGGWFDAGDYDRRQRYFPTSDLVSLWIPTLGTRRLLTKNRSGQHRPDGTPDVIQQIKHGVPT